MEKCKKLEFCYNGKTYNYFLESAISVPYLSRLLATYGKGGSICWDSWQGSDGQENLWNIFEAPVVMYGPWVIKKKVCVLITFLPLR